MALPPYSKFKPAKVQIANVLWRSQKWTHHSSQQPIVNIPQNMGPNEKLHQPWQAEPRKTFVLSAEITFSSSSSTLFAIWFFCSNTSSRIILGTLALTTVTTKTQHYHQNVYNHMISQQIVGVLLDMHKKPYRWEYGIKKQTIEKWFIFRLFEIQNRKTNNLLTAGNQKFRQPACSNYTWLWGYSWTYIRRCKEGWNPELKIQTIFPQQRNPKKIHP